MYSIVDCRNAAGSFGGPYFHDSANDEFRDKINTGVILTGIVNKHLIFGPQPLTGRTYLRDEPSLQNMSIHPAAIQKVSGQMKKMKEAMDKEIKQFLETGEITLGFKDSELYEQIKMLEDQAKEQTAIIIGLDDKNMNLEKELSQHRDQILAIQHLLEIMMDQKNEELREAQESREAQEAKEVEELHRVDEYNKKIVEMYDCFLFTFVPAIVMLIIGITVALYRDSRYSVYMPENRTLIMDRSS